MSTRLYKINGEYNTFEYWHDHYGYTRTPTFSVQYKTTNPWGTAFASDGYYDAEDLMDIFTFSFFVPGVVGWNGIDDLALVGYYPAAATDLTVARDSEVSNAATLTQDNETYYLVKNDIEYGWMSQAEFEARGWSTDVGDPPSYIVFDTTTGTIVHSIVDEGMVYGDVGYVLMDNTGNMITVYETGVCTESFYFTTNGRNETQNTDISHADIPVYLEDGTAPAADTPYDRSSVLAFMDVTGNTKQADGESLYVDDGELRLDAPDTDEGEQWAALVEYIEPLPEDDPTKPLTFKATSDGSSLALNKIGSLSETFEYSTDGGVTWLSYTFGLTVNLNTGDTVAFRTVADRTVNQTSSNRIAFSLSGTIEARHNVMSLLYHSEYENKVSIPITYTFFGLFNGCASLTRAPLLPATTLAGDCYREMFYGCTALTQAPELPATTLAGNCYDAMFYGCTALTQAPELPATSVTRYGYRQMFNRCSNLTVIKCYATSFGTSATVNWLVDVPATGDFYANPNTTWASGSSGIPSGWTRHDIV